MKQMELIRPEMQKLDVEVVTRQSSFTSALILCQTLSGKEDKQICDKKCLDLAPATWSRIKAGDNNFPQDLLNRYMDYCENEAPLIWLADSRGYTLTPKETEWQRQARIEREEKEKVMAENALLRNLLVGRSAA